MSATKQQPTFEIDGNKLALVGLAELLFERMGYHSDALEGLRIGREHDRGLRDTFNVYRDDPGGRVLHLGKIRVTASGEPDNGASYTGLLPTAYHPREEPFPEEDVQTYFIAGDFERHFDNLREADGYLEEEEPQTDFEHPIDSRNLEAIARRHI